jgi:hypothetical protein
MNIYRSSVHDAIRHHPGRSRTTIFDVSRQLWIFGFVLATSAAMLAHHSVPAEYNVSQTLTIHGAVTRIEWMNPHAHFWVQVKNDDGTVSEWKMELPAPNALIRESVKRDFIKEGDQVTVSLWPAKDGSRLAHTLTLTFPDGRVMNFPRNWMPASSP